jgi:asparagine synthase (glutamine-hydrolysing)
MCGICGIAPADLRPIDRAPLQRMNAALVHRGPDSEGMILRPGVGLASRRLAVIDLVSGDQPIANEDGSLWIVLNGEIYNFPELRADLERRGHRFQTHSDTETVLHLYEEVGEACVEHLRGMFALALWDGPRHRLLLARDRLGKKPLYYARRGGVLYFSSELPSLLQALPERPALDLQAIDLYLALQYIPDPWTPFEGIVRLPAAHRLLWSRGDLNLERYWDLSYLPKWQASEGELIEQLRFLLREAVRCRLISDVPLGAHLSGGIDSSIVVALMAEAGEGPVKTFSIGFEEESFSELPYARAVSQRYATDHHEFVVSFGDVRETLPSLIRHLGEPLADPSALALFHLSHLTRQHVTVALNGDGGDEAFAGYHRYWLDPWADRYLRLPKALTGSAIPALVRRLPHGIDRPVGSDWRDGLRRLEQLPAVDRRASILRWGSYFSAEQRKVLWRRAFHPLLAFDRPEKLLVSLYDNAPAATRLDRTQYADIHTYLPGDLLVKADRMTMAASLEGRSPFLDHQLMEWAARLPDRYRLSGRTGKVLLRKAFRAELPPEIRPRGKQGFGLPVSAWFRGPLAGWAGGMLRDPGSPLQRWFEPAALERLLVEHQAGTHDHGKRLWALVVLNMWADWTGVDARPGS